MSARLTYLLRRRPDIVAVMGCLIGFTAATLVFPGGDDAGRFYMLPYWPGTTAPAYVHLLTAPFTGLPWPLPWTVLTAFTVIGLWIAQRIWSWAPWWMVLLSVPVVWGIWIGQIEVLPALGAALGWLVVNRKVPPVWLGLALILLAVKSQVGVGLGLLFVFWVTFDQGWRVLIPGAVLALGILAVSFVAYGNWLTAYLAALRELAPEQQQWNAAIFPWGIVAVPIALMPRRVSRHRRARMIAAATLLASPYFGTYHAVTLMTMETRRAVFLACCVVGVPLVVLKSQQFGAIIPIVALALDAYEGWRSRGEDTLNS